MIELRVITDARDIILHVLHTQMEKIRVTTALVKVMVVTINITMVLINKERIIEMNKIPFNLK